VAKGFDTWDDDPLDFDKPRADLGDQSLNHLKAVQFEQLGQFKQAGKFPV
jgi:hypothetical protein